GVVPVEGPIRRIARRFEIASERFADLITLLTHLRFGSNGRCDCSALDDLEDRCPHRVVDTQPAKRDAAPLAIVKQTAMTAIAPALHAGARSVRARRGGSLTVRVGAAVDRIVEHPVDGGVAGAAPGDVAVVAPCG